MLKHLLVAVALTAPGLSSASAAPVQAGDSERVIVTLEDTGSARAAAAELAREGATVHHQYARVLPGFAATVPAGRVEALRHDPRVRSVVPDGSARPDDHVGVPWGLDRIDQRQGPGDGVYASDTVGRGVTAYVIDSGIRTTHQDFGGRARWGVDLVDGTRSDCTGHGTHVAGTIGGATYGVAPAVDLVAVRVFGCSHDVAASWSTIIAGLDWVVTHRTGASVVNMSLSGLAHPAMDEAVARATAAGVPVVVTAGNDGYDACQKSPARAPSALTIGAVARTDARASFSNTGSCLDLFAPGVDVPSASTWDDAGHWLSSGTSMAAAHVSGAVARHLQVRPAATVAELSTALVSTATPDVVTDSRSATSALLHLAPVMTSTPTTVSAPGAPQGLTASANANSLTASWRPPASDGGAQLSGYAVQVTDTRSGAVTTRQLASSATGVTVPTSSRKTLHRVEVRAVNAAGSSQPARASTTTK